MSPVPYKGPTPRFYHPELDGLRFIAFLAVFLHHVWELSPPRTQLLYAVWWSGTVGVDLFFVLSGFLITELLRRESAHHGNVHLPSFYARRCLRIWPLYFLMLAIAWVGDTAWFAYRGMSATEAILFATFLGNWSCVWFSFPVSVASALWTVSIEEQFYLLWPLLVRRFTPRRITIAALGLVALGSIIRVIGIARGWSDLTLYTSTFTHMEGLACGALLAAWLEGNAPRLSGFERKVLWMIGLALPVLVFRFSGMGLDGHSDWRIAVQPPLIVLSSVLILVATLRPNEDRPGLLARPTFVWLGVISYGLYVYHRPVLRLVAILFASNHWGVPILYYAMLCLALTVLVASVSYAVLERPFLRWKSRFQREAGPTIRPASHPLINQGLSGVRP